MTFQKALRLQGGRAVLLAAVLLAAAPGRAQDEGLDVVYAEHMPLASKSLLLDIIAVGGHGFVAVGERGHVVRSADGSSWVQAEVVPTRSTLTTIAMGGERLWAAGHDSTIITSGDYGKTWTQQYFEPESQQPIMDIYFFDANNGLAIGAYGLALRTRDGGKTWGEVVINEEEWHNNALLDLGGGRLLAAGEAGFSYRSADGGETWETIEMPYAGSMFGIVAGAGECVMVFGLRGHAQESCDFGDTWMELDTTTEASIAGGILSNGVNVLVGNSGLVLTRKAGGPFTARYHSSGVDFAAVVTGPGNRFLLVGEDGVHVFPEEEGAAVE